MVLTDRPLLGPRHVLVVGSGELGAAVAKALVDHGNTVHVMDRTPDAFDRLPSGAVEEGRIIPVVGDGASHDDLARAGIREVDVFMSVMRDDSDNVLAAQVAKHEFNVDVVVCRVDDPDLQSMYEELGLITIGATSLLVEVAVQTATACWGTDRMHVIVVGADRLGQAVARWLVAGGHEIAVVDSSRERCIAIDEAFGSVSVLGSSVDRSILAQAGANRAEILIATDEDDGANLVTCQMAKQRFGVPTTISVVNRSDHVDLFNVLGIDVVVDVPDLILNQIQEGFTSHGITHLKPLPADGTQRSLVSIHVPAAYGSDGLRLMEFPFPDGTLPSLVVTRDGVPRLPSGDVRIRAGDEIIAVTTAEGEDELRDLLESGPLL